MSNKEWDLISYNQSAKPEEADKLLWLMDENQKLKTQLGEATMMILNLEKKLTELKAR